MSGAEAMKPIPDPDPPLEDGVIQLRWLRAEDAEAVTAACQDPQIPRWTFMAEGLTLEQAAEWIEQSREKRAAGTGARFAIVDVDNDSLLGQVGVAIDRERQSGETFYWVAADARGRGVATTALRLISRWALDVLALERLELFIDPDNTPSQRVAERSGYLREGILRSHQPFKDHRMDSVVFSLLPSDLKATPAR
jgi:RimJ/RimL family protein N-acetyltransferase